MNNPYQPSNAALKESPRRQRPPRSVVLSVIVGIVVDIGGTLVASIVVGIVYTIVLASRGTPPEQIQAALTQVDTSSGYFNIMAAVGLGFSVLGGYVCARMVRRNELRVATILALLITLGGVVLSGESSLGLWAAVAWNVVGFAAVLLGGEVGRRRNRALVSENSAAASTQ